MKFKDYFNNDFETSDSQQNKDLRTRYYRCRPDAAIEAVKEIANEEMLKITGITSRNEITIESVNYFAIVTICETSPMESAIDIKITTNHGIFDFGRGPKYIIALYEALDKKLPFKGRNLYKDFNY